MVGRLTLDWVIRKSLFEEMTFDLNKKLALCNELLVTHTRQRNSKYKNSEAEMSLGYLKNTKNPICWNLWREEKMIEKFP